MLNEKANKPMNQFNQYLKHKGHLERIYLSKSLINNKCPIVPSFFQKGLKNKEKELENKFKITNDNKVLFKKIINTANSKSKYNQIFNTPSKCPAFERKDKIQIRRFKNIINENYLFYKILRKTKSTLDNSKNEEDYLHSRNLDFANYRQFHRNVKITFKDRLFNKISKNFHNKNNQNENIRYKISLYKANNRMHSSL